MQALNAKQISLKNERKKAVAAINATAEALQYLLGYSKPTVPVLISKSQAIVNYGHDWI